MRLGMRVLRLDDGMVGSVEEVIMPGSEVPEKRIVYHDRGERRIAAKTETWVSAEPAPSPMRAEEKFLIALYADKALRAYEKHEPLKFWQPPRLSDEPYDNELVVAILSYLSKRELAGPENR